MALGPPSPDSHPLQHERKNCIKYHNCDLYFHPGKCGFCDEIVGDDYIMVTWGGIPDAPVTLYCDRPCLKGAMNQ